MVRRYTNRRTYRRKRVYKKKDTVKKVRRTVNKLKRQIEVKHYTKYEFINPVGSAPLAYLDLMPTRAFNQDVTASGIIGDKYHCRGVLLQAQIYKVIDQVAPSCVRIVMLWVKGNPSASTPLWGDFFQPTDNGGTIIPTFQQILRPQQTKNVKVLYDRKHTLGLWNDTNAYATAPTIKHIKKYIPLNKMSIFDSAGQINGRLVMFLFDRFADHCTCQYITRLYYDDM